MEGALFSKEGDEIMESHVAVHVHEEDGEMMVSKKVISTVWQ